jgi:hypothetical protein
MIAPGAEDAAAQRTRTARTRGAEDVIELQDREAEFLRAVGLSQRELKRGRKGKPTCADCFFHCNQLCALDLAAPCSTFRPDSPRGLVPPRQPALLVRQGEA